MLVTRSLVGCQIKCGSVTVATYRETGKEKLEKLKTKHQRRADRFGSPMMTGRESKRSLTVTDSKVSKGGFPPVRSRACNLESGHSVYGVDGPIPVGPLYGKLFGSGRSKRRRADTRQVTAVLQIAMTLTNGQVLSARSARLTGGQMPSPMPAGGSPSS